MNRLQRPKPGAHQSAPPVPVERELDIGAIGARGDALAEGDGQGPIYAPFALPGERVRARVVGDRATVLEVLSPSAERRPPACRHFGRCGGCQLQHWEEAAYLAWKRERVIEALGKRGMSFDVAATVPAWGAGRRRAAFHAARLDGRVRLGFVERGGARLMPIQACPVLTPNLEAVALKLSAVAELFVPVRGEITLQCLETETGVDVAIKGAGRADALGRAMFEAAVGVCETLDLARLSVDGEPIVTRRPPRVRMGAAVVAPPPGAFLQPTVLGEETLAGLALDALDGAKRVLDLFSGIGTFALRAAQQAEVQAAESEEAMLAALKAAADAAALKQVTILRRDLLRTPLSSLEMKKFDGAVIDPPRSGARLQVEQLARAGVRKVAYVSCDPSSFARDVRILNDHGFTLTKVTPVDQFRWSPHVEIVGVLER